jgi:hypothetical protein
MEDFDPDNIKSTLNLLYYIPEKHVDDKISYILKCICESECKDEITVPNNAIVVFEGEISIGEPFLRCRVCWNKDIEIPIDPIFMEHHNYKAFRLEQLKPEGETHG